MALATHKSRATILCRVGLGLLGAANPALASSTAAATEFVAYAQRGFQAAQARYQQAPGEATAAWEFGRACFDLAEFATNNSQRASLAEQGIAACRLAIAHASNSAPAHLYLGLNLGQLARTKTLAALKLVDQMLPEFIRARDLDEHLNYAGPDRYLGMLYRDAPAIGSVGNRTSARKCLKRAVELAPHYPENRLNLIEAYLEWGERPGAHRELQALETAWPGAQTTLVGEAWAASWADWEARLQKVKKRLGEPRKALGAPRQRD